jgi:hypothetical protein
MQVLSDALAEPFDFGAADAVPPAELRDGRGKRVGELRLVSVVGRTLR